MTRAALAINYASPDWRSRLLQLRADELARPLTPATSAEPIRRCLLMHVGAELAAIEAGRIADVQPYREPALLPAARGAVLGLTGRSGAFRLLYDLAALLGRPPSDAPNAHVVRLRAPLADVAFKVDRAEAVADLALTDLDPAGATRLHPAVAALARLPGEANGLVPVLDLDRLLPRPGEDDDDDAMRRGADAEPVE